MDRQTVKLLAPLVLLVFAAGAAAEERRLFEHEPYDLLILNDKPRTTLRTAPLDLPGRTLPKNPDPKSLLRLRLFDQSLQPYDVAWKDVAEIRLFEQLLLDETLRLAKEHRFAEAFEYFIYLRREHPKLPGLEEAETTATIAEVEFALAEGRPDAALARLLRLQQRNALHPQLPDLAARTTEQLVTSYLMSDQPRAARTTVERFARQYAKHPQAVALQSRLEAAAAEQLTSSRQALAEKRFVAAQAAAQTAVLLAADAAPALEIYRQAVEAYPTLTVGVVETTASAEMQRVPSWAALRVAPLDRQPVLELTLSAGESPRATYDGGKNRWETDDRDPLQFRLRLGGGAKSLTAAAAAAMFAAASRLEGPTSRPDLIDLQPELRVVDPGLLDLHFGRPHPRPEALVADVLAGPLDRWNATAPAAPYPIVDRGDDRTVRHRDDAVLAAGPMEIVERRFADEEEAAAALLAGTIDVVDRVAPWQTARLRERRELHVVRYAAPSVHLLLFNGNQPRLQNAELRRAVCYALDRESILRNHLQPERDDLAARTTDGVFPIGRTTDDPLGYAYDLTGESRVYDPQRAFLLATLAQDAASAAPPLVLTHPATATAAKACRRIAAYLRQVGIAVELRTATADQTPTSAAAADLTYVVISSTEPLIDVQRLFGRDGLVNLESRALRAALRQAAQAESIATSRAALFEVQRVLHDEALLAPLWQLSEHAVQRSRIVSPPGIVPTSLYQRIDRRQVLPQFNEALP